MADIGGQAVIEGVMMRNGNKWAVATAKKGRIKVKMLRYKPLHPLLVKLPFVRGVFSLVDMLIMGMKALFYSANEAEGKGERLTFWEMFVSIAFAVVFTIGIFIVLPYFAAGLFSNDKGLLFNLADGLIRIAFFVIYVLAISMMADIRRVFEYHGAEHKAVNCHEAGLAMNVKNCSRFSTVHRRCGTTFIMIVLVISILLFSAIRSDAWQWQLLIRLLLIPVIAGVSYELLKFGARHEKSIMVNILVWPGLALQRITTREPSAAQLKVAIAALKRVE